MSTDTARTAAVLRKLAEAEGPCQGTVCVHNRAAASSGLPSIDTLDECQGTGRAPLFRNAKGEALFRKPCSSRVGGHPVRRPETHRTQRYVSCHEVGCPGWVPLALAEVHLETVADACDSQDWKLEFGVHTEDGYFMFVHTDKRAYVGCAANRVEAALMALVAAMEARA